MSIVLNIYVDESSQNDHRFVVLGGIAVDSDIVSAVISELETARLPELPFGELKWTRVTNAKFEAYRRYVEVFFKSARRGQVEFHSLVLEAAKIDDRAFNGGSRELGFNKEIYQLLMKFGRLNKYCLFHVYPDRRSTNRSTEELRLILNRGMSKFGDKRSWPFRRLHFRDSSDDALLQLTDLLIGAIAFRINGHYEAPNASAAKRQLSDLVLSMAKVADPFRDTALSGVFTIWHRRLQKRVLQP